MVKKVFISSTYLDLKQFRQNLWDTLNQPEIEILGMEEFGARSATPLETCLSEVKRCDIFICLIGYKLGSIDKLHKKSFTQLEYEVAFEEHKDILIYFMADDILLLPNQIDLGNNSIKLQRFKKLLKRRHTIDFFKDPIELEQKVSQALNQILLKKLDHFIRPKVLDAKFKRYAVGDTIWVFYVGYFNNRPMEVYCLPEKQSYLPKSVESGWLMESFTTYGRRIDLQFKDIEGYKTTCEGTNRKANAHIFQYCSIVNLLLRSFVEQHILNETIDSFEVFDIKEGHEWKKGLKEAIEIPIVEQK
jgi:hypothetical protein